MAFSGEDLSEYFDTDDFDDAHRVTYRPGNGLPVTPTIFLTERSGVLEDGTVRAAYYEVVINRQEVTDPKIGDEFDLNSDSYGIKEIIAMDNDIAVCEADKVS